MTFIGSFFPREINITTSVTRLGNLLHFGQLFKASGNNYFAQIVYILGNYWKGVKIFDFSCEIIFGNFYKHLATFLLLTLIMTTMVAVVEAKVVSKFFLSSLCRAHLEVLETLAIYHQRIHKMVSVASSSTSFLPSFVVCKKSLQ